MITPTNNSRAEESLRIAFYSSSLSQTWKFFLHPILMSDGIWITSRTSGKDIRRLWLQSKSRRKAYISRITDKSSVEEWHEIKDQVVAVPTAMMSCKDGSVVVHLIEDFEDEKTSVCVCLEAANTIVRDSSTLFFTEETVCDDPDSVLLFAMQAVLKTGMPSIVEMSGKKFVLT